MPAVVHTVLVVDDEVTVRSVMARTLMAEGYHVLTASDGDEALFIARTLAGQISLVVTDLQMPQMDGTTLAAHLADMTPAPRVLFVSGYGVPAEHELPGPFLAKPFSLNDLANCVRQMLDASDGVRATQASM